jgi:L1 cell adhesion molecule like protein
VITNDKGRLSKEDIDRMVEEAERYKQEDDAVREKVEAKNSLEATLYQLKTSVTDEKGELAGKLGEDDKKSLLDKVTEVENWSFADSYTKEEYADKQKELQEFFSKVAGNVASSASFSAEPVSPEQAKTASSEDDNYEPKIEEID